MGCSGASHPGLTGFRETRSIIPSVTCFGGRGQKSKDDRPPHSLLQSNAPSCLSWPSTDLVPPCPGWVAVGCLCIGGGRKVSSCHTHHGLGQMQHEPCSKEEGRLGSVALGDVELPRMEGEAGTTVEGENPFPPMPTACLEAGDGSLGLASPASVRSSSLAGCIRVMIKLHKLVCP